MDIVVFTDGSCIKKRSKRVCGGYGIHFPNKEYEDVSKPFLLEPVTNQRAELYAVYKAIKIVEKNEFKSLTIYTDSIYTLKSVTVWINEWVKNGWKTANKKPVKNQDIIKSIYKLLSKYKGKISIKHVYAHTGGEDWESVCNSCADKLAVEGSTKAINHYNKKINIDTSTIDQYYDSKVDEKKYSIKDIQIKTKKRRKRIKVDIE